MVTMVTKQEIPFMRRSRMNLYLTKISRSYIKGIMRYRGGGCPDPPIGIRCSTKTLGIRRVKVLSLAGLAYNLPERGLLPRGNSTTEKFFKTVAFFSLVY